MCPGDWKFTLLTLAIIVIPSGMCFYCIFAAENVDPAIMVLLAIIYAISLFLCLRSLFRTTLADPGIIPSVEANQGEYVPDPREAYYADYLTLQELEPIMRADGIESDEAKFYALKKFKYR